MQPHQERVIGELKELTGKREKLGLFLADNPLLVSIPEDEIVRLRRQFDIMVEYEAILHSRIENF